MTYPYRPNRTKTDVIAILSAEGERTPTRVLDISRDGARIDVPHAFVRGTAVTLSVDGARMPALVAWSANDQAGLRFLDRLDRDTLVQLESAGLDVDVGLG